MGAAAEGERRWGRGPAGRTLRAALLPLILLLALPGAARAALPAFVPGETVTVARVEEDGVVLLSDGRSLALIGLALPRPKQPLAAEAKAALERLLLDHPVELRYGGIHQDRHGRVLAQLFVGRRWVQGEMLRHGLARVDGSADNRLGLDEMLKREAKARRAGSGLWSDPFYAVRAAEEAGRYAGTFQLVEGRAVDAHLVEGALFLNFAADWRHGFSLRIAPEVLRAWRQEGGDPAALAGHRLRVRGFIHGSERPVIDVGYPEQIERLR